ncbi:MAG: agmatinase [Desulfobulbaceae bacterium]|nr:agmatinase [Desulfobulbaceae bacterium]
MKTLNVESNFLAIEEEYSNLESSKIVIVPAPYEHTVSYGGGTANAPEAILKASAYVEFFDDESARELCFEKGIATIEPLDFSGKVDDVALQLIEDTVDQLLDMDKFVVTIGGEHTISSAPIKSHFKKHPNMSVLQFDAHSDFRDTYLDSKYSHASVMARVAEFFPNERITQVGIRAQCIEEYNFINANKVKTFYASAIGRGLHGEQWQKSVVDTLADEIYVTFDLDYFDPSIMPATGTPEPDGLLYNETIQLFREIKRRNKKIIGFDVVELAPVEILHHCDLTSARLIYKILNLQF